MVPSPVAADGVVYFLGGRSGNAALAVRAGGRGDIPMRGQESSAKEASAAAAFRTWRLVAATQWQWLRGDLTAGGRNHVRERHLQ